MDQLLGQQHAARLGHADRGGAQVLAGAIYGGAPFASLEAEGLLTLTGDRAKAERFTTFFDLPEKAAA